MYWLPKMHNKPIGARFTVTSKNCIGKPHVESFHTKSLFYTYLKKFSVVENSVPIVTKLNKISTKKKAKSISVFDFTTLCTIIPHNLLIKVLSAVINFYFKRNLEIALAFQKYQSTGHQKTVHFSSRNSILLLKT